MTLYNNAIMDYAYSGMAPIPGEQPPLSSGGAQWPRMLNLDDDTEDRLKRFLWEEIRMARMEKQDLVDDWIQWQADYWATPASKEKNFPFRKAANVVIPITAIAVEAIYARIMNTIFAVKPFWSIRPKRGEWVDAAKPFEEFLQTEVENPNSLDAYAFCQDSVLELVKLGTAIGKSGYERDIRKSVKTIGETEMTHWYERHNGATLDYVPVANFLMRMSEQDPQTSTWCGEEHSFTWSQLKRMSLSGRISPDSVESIRVWWLDQRDGLGGEEYEEELDKLAHTEPLWGKTFKTEEIWAAFDVDKDGVDEEIVIDFHWRSNTILSIRYNWYEDMHRPYRIGQYIKVEGRWAGIGVGKQNEQFQDIITTIHRQKLDNATLANMRMIAIKKGSGYGPDEPVFPGKMWFLDDPVSDIHPLEMSEIYQSSFVNEEVLVRYSDKRTGANDLVLGIPQSGTPGTATGDLSRLAESNKKFDLVLKNVRRWFSLLGADVVENYQQFGDQRRHYLVLDPEEAQWVDKILQMPSSLVSEGAIVELTATDSVVNRQVEQQQWMSLFQLMRGYYTELVQLAELVQDPQLLQYVVQRALKVGDEALKRLLNTFNQQETDRLLLIPEKPQGGPNGPPRPTDRLGQLVGPSAQPGGGGFQFNSLIPRMGNLAGSTPFVGRNGSPPS